MRFRHFVLIAVIIAIFIYIALTFPYFVDLIDFHCLPPSEEVNNGMYEITEEMYWKWQKDYFLHNDIKSMLSVAQLSYDYGDYFTTILYLKRYLSQIEDVRKPFTKEYQEGQYAIFSTLSDCYFQTGAVAEGEHFLEKAIQTGVPFDGCMYTFKNLKEAASDCFRRQEYIDGSDYISDNDCFYFKYIKTSIRVYIYLYKNRERIVNLWKTRKQNNWKSLYDSFMSIRDPAMKEIIIAESQKNYAEIDLDHYVNVIKSELLGQISKNNSVSK